MDSRIIQMAKKQSRFEPAALLAFIQVETGGRGFDPKTSKLIIQFEPNWFKKLAKEEYAKYLELKAKYESLKEGESLNTSEMTMRYKWIGVLENKVGGQSFEWPAFNTAFSINPTAAMESTSIGLGQIMGFHWKRLGYTSVSEMWDDAKRGLDMQFEQLIKFIETDLNLQKALSAKDWDTVASIYNGAGYKELAIKLGREPYDISMAKAYEQFKNV